MEKHAEAEFNPRIPTTPFRRGDAYRDREAQAMQKTAFNNAARNSAGNAVRIGMAVTGPNSNQAIARSIQSNSLSTNHETFSDFEFR